MNREMRKGSPFNVCILIRMLKANIHVCFCATRQFTHTAAPDIFKNAGFKPAALFT